MKIIILPVLNRNYSKGHVCLCTPGASVPRTQIKHNTRPMMIEDQDAGDVLMAVNENNYLACSEQEL